MKSSPQRKRKGSCLKPAFIDDEAGVSGDDVGADDDELNDNDSNANNMNDFIIQLGDLVVQLEVHVYLLLFSVIK